MTPPSASVTDWHAAAAAVLGEFGVRPTALAHITQGLINLSIRVDAADGRRFVLQRLNPVFPDAVNANIARVTEHLARSGLVTPRILRTRTGALSVRHDDALWRLLSFVDGRAFDALAGPPMAAAAGALLARFHAALARYDGELVETRPPVHDLPRHLQNLDDALAAAAGHRLEDAVRATAGQLFAALGNAPAVDLGPPRIVHGDPKISNFLFSGDGLSARCLVDLDTLARMPLVLELGDAMRSWCNPRREDDARAHFDLELFGAAVRAYHAATPAALAEYASLVPATLQIHHELAARFLADAVNERYFSFDPDRYPGRGEHNLARARGQLAAAASLTAQLDQAQAIVAALA